MPGERCSWLTTTRSAPLITKVPCGRHERQFAHVNFFFLGALLFLEQEGDVQRRAVGLPFALRLEGGQLRLADVVMTKSSVTLFVVALDRKNFPEHGLEAGVLCAC